VIAVWAIFTIITGLMVPMIDNAGHVGGLLGGIATAGLLRPRILERRMVYAAPERYRIR
jgi:membrane associated rhomboid family serine protease